MTHVPDRQIDPPEYPDATDEDVAAEQTQLLRDMPTEALMDYLSNEYITALTSLAGDMIEDKASGREPDLCEYGRRLGRIVDEIANLHLEIHSRY